MKWESCEEGRVAEPWQKVTAEARVSRRRYVRQKVLLLVPRRCAGHPYIVLNHRAALHHEFHVLHL